VVRRDRRRLRRLLEEVAHAHPDIEDPDQTIRSGAVLVDGRVVANPASLVRAGATIVLRREPSLRGEAKLRSALERFAIDVQGRTALDAGAAAGGFTRALLEAGVRKVYAVDAGHGQLLGSLRQDGRVVNLEATNIGELTRDLVPDPIEVVTLDLSYLALSLAVPQLRRVDVTAGADAVAVVKPQFELGLAVTPTDAVSLGRAAAKARAAFASSGWRVRDVVESPMRGGRGAVEYLLHARRPGRRRLG